MKESAPRGFRGARTQINGDALRQLLAAKRITQTEVGARAGLSKYRVNAFCREGVRNMRLDSAQRLAAALGVTLADLAGHGLPATTAQELTPMEQEIINMYRSLSPRHQARALLAMEEIVENLEKPGRSAQPADHRQDQP